MGRKISSYPLAVTPLTGAETAIGDQNGSTVQITTQSIANLANAAAVISFPPHASAPSNPSVGQGYWDTTLGYPLIYGPDSQWHGVSLSS